MIDRAQFTGGLQADMPIPLTDNCTVPTESMARMLCDAMDCRGKRVLEIGTGSGYQAAVLAEVAKEVVTIEVHPLASVDLLPPNVTTITGDGSVFDSGEQFDAVLVTCGAKAIAPVWTKQMLEGGLLIVPLERRGVCAISLYQKIMGLLDLIDVLGYAPFTQLEKAC